MRPAVVLSLIAISLIVGCAAPDQQKATATVATPLSDLNLVNAPIPETLVLAQKAPYRMPEDGTCSGLVTEIKALDSVLGADLDTPPTESNPSLVERSGSLVASSAQKAVEGAIPFRGWIRKLSGAERYSKQVSAAIAAGAARRSFLKGVAQGRGC
jgi:hypothetical protein